MEKESILMNFPFESKFIEIKKSKIHYIDTGKGNPILFLHGIPASSYVWRNIIPHLENHARCIALDLVGMGKSAKPRINYRIFDYIEYVEEFIKALNLKNITYVLHGWGSVIGFHCAMKYEGNTKGIAFYESHIHPSTDWNHLSLPVQHLASLLHHPERSYNAIVNNNYFIKKILPAITLRKLEPEEFEHYSEPFRTQESRKLLWQYIQDLPFDEDPNDVAKLILSYVNKIQKSNIPKLMFYAVPGFLTTIETVKWCRDHLPHLSIIDLGEALHFAQEVQPDKFGKNLQNWFKSKVY